MHAEKWLHLTITFWSSWKQTWGVNVTMMSEMGHLICCSYGNMTLVEKGLRGKPTNKTSQAGSG